MLYSILSIIPHTVIAGRFLGLWIFARTLWVRRSSFPQVACIFISGVFIWLTHALARKLSAAEVEIKASTNVLNVLMSARCDVIVSTSVLCTE